jgi:hypothetical protein
MGHNILKPQTLCSPPRELQISKFLAFGNENEEADLTRATKYRLQVVYMRFVVSLVDRA